MRHLSVEERGRVLTEASRAAIVGGLLELRSGGRVLAAGADMDELLGRAVRRERVEVEVDLLSFEQGKRDKDGQVIRNRNGVRFRDGAMSRLGRSGVGTPYLRDHRQGDSTAIGGRIVKSATIKADDIGHYQVKQTVLVTEPAAVERLLRGLVSAVSIGWHPTGPVMCTACKAEILTECWHWPLDVVHVDGEEHVVEWEYTEAELVETSECPVPAVPTAGIEGIRAALSAAHDGGPTPATRRESTATERHTAMSLRTHLLTRLQLAGLIAATAAPNATDDEILGAVDSLVASQAELAILRQDLAAAPADAFIRDALASGRITPADEKPWRTLYSANAERARAMMAERAPGIATPVGQQRQSAAADAADADVAAAASAAVGGTGTAEQKRDHAAAAVLAKNGVDHGRAVKFAAAFGAKDPKAAIAKHAAGVGEN